MKHTQGPWEASKMFLGKKEKDRRSGVVVNGPDLTDALPTRVCDMRCGQDKGFTEMNANAKLIAAAPDMLEALAECIHDLQTYASTHGPAAHKRFMKAIAAIRKATK